MVQVCVSSQFVATPSAERPAAPHNAALVPFGFPKDERHQKPAQFTKPDTEIVRDTQPGVQSHNVGHNFVATPVQSRVSGAEIRRPSRIQEGQGAKTCSTPRLTVHFTKFCASELFFIQRCQKCHS